MLCVWCNEQKQKQIFPRANNIPHLNSVSRDLSWLNVFDMCKYKIDVFIYYTHMDLYPNAGSSSISEFSRTFLSNTSMFIHISLKSCCIQYIIKEMKLFNEFFPFFIMPCFVTNPVKLGTKRWSQPQSIIFCQSFPYFVFSFEQQICHCIKSVFEFIQPY